MGAVTSSKRRRKIGLAAIESAVASDSVEELSEEESFSIDSESDGEWDDLPPFPDRNPGNRSADRRRSDD